MKFPAHKAGMSLCHNEHKNYYETVASHLEFDGARYDFKDAKARQRCIDTDELWSLQWYPNTPVGFECVAAPTLEECLALAAEVEARRNADQA